MIAEEIKQITDELPKGTRLVAVSKYHPADQLMEAYNAGQRIFGESHVQELQLKHEALPKDIEWHFIGHLQTNKVKYIAPYVSLIHAVDTPKLLAEINKQGVKHGRKIPCLLQIHIAQEETKFGFTPEECTHFLRSGDWQNLEGTQICGIMCMASNVDDEKQIANEFAFAESYFRQIKEDFFKNEPAFCECSWGMSDDYSIALQHGSTLVRIGTRIFGQRQY